MKPVDYVRAGWALVPIPKGLKGPTVPDWNSQERVITTEDRAKNLHENIGIAHAYSGTCAIDIDDAVAARTWLAERGVDLDAMLSAPDSVRITSGRLNRAKLLYRLREPLVSKKIIEEKRNIIDFRCATPEGKSVQDVLPPSIHPETGKPYQWEYGDELVGHWLTLPELPEDVLTLWRELITARAELHVEHTPSFSIERLRYLLAYRDPDCDRDSWVKVLAAIHFETGGSAEGLDLADEWSAKGKKYAGRKDVLGRWRSFKTDKMLISTCVFLKESATASVDDY